MQQNGTRAEAAGEVRPPANSLQLQAEQGLRAGYGATGQFAGLAANPLQIQPDGPAVLASAARWETGGRRHMLDRAPG
jgi:hypothetical protein